MIFRTDYIVGGSLRAAFLYGQNFRPDRGFWSFCRRLKDAPRVGGFLSSAER